MHKLTGFHCTLDGKFDQQWNGVLVERSVFPAVVEAGGLYGFVTDDYWLDTGRPDQYLRANLDLLRGVRGSVSNGVHAKAVVHPDAMVLGSVVGPGATVASGARVTDSVLLPGSIVRPGAAVDRSIVAGEIGQNAVVVDGIVGSGYLVEAGAEVVDRRLPKPD